MKETSWLTRLSSLPHPSQAPAADGGRGPAGEGVGPAAALPPRHLGQTLPDQRDLLAAQRHGLHDGPGERLRGVSVAPPKPAANLNSHTSKIADFDHSRQSNRMDKNEK